MTINKKKLWDDQDSTPVDLQRFHSYSGRSKSSILWRIVNIILKWTVYQLYSIRDKGYEEKGHTWRGLLDTTLRDKVCQWLATGRLLSPDTPDSSTNKTGHNDIAEILFKVELNTITLKLLMNRTINPLCKQKCISFVDQTVYVLSWNS
jgi:hypothetical protein